MTIRENMVAQKQKIKIEGHKLMYHATEVSKWLKGEVVAPIYVEIGLVNSCNHKCVFCALDYLKHKGTIINKEVLITNLQDMATFGVKSIMFGGEGEPLLHPHLFEIIEKAKESGLDLAITTNGVLLTEEKIKKILKHLSWIKLSVDAGTNEGYRKIHGCREEDFSTVLKNIDFACKYRKENDLNCKIGCQFLLISENINEIEALILKIKDLGVDYLVLKPYSQHPSSINRLKLNLYQHDSRLANLSAKYSTDHFQVIYRNISAEEVEKEELDYKQCYGINFFCLMDALGNIIPCNLFYEKEEYTYGNINQKKFREIWNGDQRKAVLSRIYKEGCVNCRKGCRLNFVNKYLDIVMNKNIEHINFI